MGCEYSTRSGKKSNSESREVGVVQIQDDVLTYTSSFIKKHTCLRGGKGRFNPLTCKKKNCSTIGTNRLGCNASIHVRLLNISNGDQILEIKFPLEAAHLPTHTVSSIMDQLTLKPLSVIENKVAELLQECLLNRKALVMCLKTWVQKELIPEHMKSGILTSVPSEYNRAYYPTNAEIRVMIAKAITKECNSLFDQDAVLSLLKEYEAKGNIKYFFRQYNTGNNK